MLGLYLMTFAFGGVLIGTSVFFGGGDDSDLDKDFDLDKDLDLDADADADVDVEADAEAGFDLSKDASDLVPHEAMGADSAAWIWLPFLSLRFWSFGSASFGATGLLLTMASLPSAVALGASTVAGLGIGTTASWVFRKLRKDFITADTRLDRFVGEQATVVLRVTPGGLGKIRIETSGGDVVVAASTRDRHELARGSAVLIASFDGHVAQVTGIHQIEQHES